MDNPRSERLLEKRVIKDLNNLGPRLVFCRVKLDLLQREVAEGINIPANTYCEREGGARTEIYEELGALAVFLDKKWQAKYSKYGAYPVYKGMQLKRITFVWIVFGSDEENLNLETLIEELKFANAEREKDLAFRVLESKNQMDMFK